MQNYFMLETLTPQGGFCIACILEKRVTWAGPRSITLKTEYNKQTQESNIPTLETLAVGDVETGPKPQEQRLGKTLVEAVGVAGGGGGGGRLPRARRPYPHQKPGRKETGSDTMLKTLTP
jgi:hypothetical protein